MGVSMRRRCSSLFRLAIDPTGFTMPRFSPMAFFPSRTALYELSRNRSVLIRTAVVIALISIGAALVIDRVRGDQKSMENIMGSGFLDLKSLFEAKGQIEMVEQSGHALAGLSPNERVSPDAIGVQETTFNLIQNIDVSEPERVVLRHFIDLCATLPPDASGLAANQAWQDLDTTCQTDSASESARARAHICSAEVLRMLNEEKRAIRLLEEGRDRCPDSVSLTRRMIAFARHAKDRSTLRSILNDPRTETQLEPIEMTRLAVDSHAYGPLFVHSLRQQWEALNPVMLVLSTIACGIWFCIILQTGRGWKHWPLMVVAVVLGALSTIVALYGVLVHEHMHGFKETGQLGRDLIFWIAGVGLREELAKLLLFLPLLPWLIRRGTQLDALLAASCVGLGFALEENVGYFVRETANNSWGRFLTANFVHLALTGIVGHAVWAAIKDWRRQWENALTDLLAAVIAHGLYDAFAAIPALAKDYSIGSLFVLAYISYRYFSLLSQARGVGRSTIAPLGIFCVGCALLLGIALNQFLWEIPFADGFSSFGRMVIGIFPVAFLFIRQFRDA